MKSALAAIVLASGIAVAFATGSTENLSPRVRDTLTAIDTVPSRDALNHAFKDMGGALPNLSSIAKDGAVDVGVRIRAIHALAKYCPAPCADTDPAHASLKTIISATSNESTGEPVVLLRAAIETIGTLDVDNTASAQVAATLVVLLDHPSRDIRAATARALRDLCNSSAIVPLRTRYQHAGEVEQVKLAISEALRILDQCTP